MNVKITPEQMEQLEKQRMEAVKKEIAEEKKGAIESGQGKHPMMDELNRRHIVVRPEFLGLVQAQPEGKPTVVSMNADALIPMLAYLRKFFKCIKETYRPDGPSRFSDPRDFRMSISTQGFTPEDFNSLQSLANSVGGDVKRYLDAADALQSPQMARTDLKTGKALLSKAENENKNEAALPLGPEKK